MARLQLDFLDGLRAVLALYIVLHHTMQLGSGLPYTLLWLGHGQEVVALFMTVSGFCLALPMASSGHWMLDVRAFYQRRARRILPPYYAALAIALAVRAGFAVLGPFRDRVEVFSMSSVWSHLFLVQNWSPRLMYTLDGPLWSIALECQIYLLYPVLVLLRRKWGIAGMLGVAFVAAVMAFRLLHALGQMQFLLFFALGIVSAQLAFERRRQWVCVGLVCFGVLGCSFLPHASLPERETFTSMAGAGMIALLCQSPNNLLRRALEWKPLAWLGTFSYSIYLLHALVLGPVFYWIRDRQADFSTHLDATFLLAMGAACVLAVACSYGFHILFERPFLSNKRKQAEHRLAAVSA